MSVFIVLGLNPPSVFYKYIFTKKTSYFKFYITISVIGSVLYDILKAMGVALYSYLVM